MLQNKELKPDNFALQLADSAQSIDFDVSESKTMGPHGPAANELAGGQ